MVTTRSGKNTSGLVLFNKARDVSLSKRGIAGFPGLTAATRAEYRNHEQSFKGWNKARDVVLVNAGFRGGYTGLMAEAKAEHRKLVRSPRIVDARRSEARAADARAAKTRCNPATGRCRRT